MQQSESVAAEARMVQDQRVAMTFEMRQSLHILALSGTELETYLDEQWASNPMLDEPPARRRAAAEPPPEPAVEWPRSLQDDLRWQALSVRPAELRAAVEALIALVDDNGYLPEDAEGLLAGQGCGGQAFRRALAALQECDPPGVGARSLAECLRLQLLREQPTPCANEGARRLALWIVDGMLPELAAGRISAIARRTGASTAQVREAAALIASLRPKPGAAVGMDSGSPPVRPDLRVIEEDGRLRAVCADESPEPRVHPEYQAWLARPDLPTDAREYLRAHLRQARWLIRALRQRRETLEKVGQAIVEHQEAHLRDPRLPLRPLSLEEVARATGLHVSTVSRAVREKWLASRHGTVALKRLFTRDMPRAIDPSGAIRVGAAAGASVDAIKRTLVEILDRESRAHPLSDRQLADTLARRGWTVARRTVAKYRAELGYRSRGLRFGPSGK